MQAAGLVFALIGLVVHWNLLENLIENLIEKVNQN